MKKVLAAIAVMLSLSSFVQADVFNLGSGFINLETVTVGDIKNGGQLSGAGAGGNGPNRVCGSVLYVYKIGKYEVTAKQYTDFLNAKAIVSDIYGLYSTQMVGTAGCNIIRSGVSGSYNYSVAIDWANRPVNFISYWDSLRFINWLNNGQGNGDTETGAYTLNGYNGNDGRTITRNAGAKWALPNEDEWYKSAYYRGGTNPRYWMYPTQSFTTPANQVLPIDPGNSANYILNDHCIDEPYYRTNVGEFENSSSYYGTYDQGGNVAEWNEAIIYQYTNYISRSLRGASCATVGGLQSSFRADSTLETTELYQNGFRIVQIVPETSSILAICTGLVPLGLMFKRRK